jgi:hypothetical protein
VTRRATTCALLLVATGCGSLLSFSDGVPPAPDGPADAGAESSANDVVVSQGASDASDPCAQLVAPSFCEGFDGPTLDPAWTKGEASGGVVSLVSGGEIGGALRGAASVADPNAGTGVAYAFVARRVEAAVRSIDCSFRARADAISWSNTFDVMVVDSVETPGWSLWFATLFSWDDSVGATVNSTLADGGNVQYIPRGTGAIAPDVWVDVRVAMSSTDGWILHGSIGTSKIDLQLPAPGAALVNPTLRFGMHYGLFEDGTTAMHLDVDRVVCVIATL